jgi:hypothetical protein
VSDTRHWLERAVIGLNLCPFARAVHARGHVHYAVSRASGPAEVLHELERECEDLAGLEAAVRETTLLIIPGCLHEFFEFNDLVGKADRLLRKRGFGGVMQLASFHPAYQFAESEPDDMANFSNRSPYPTIQLLREASVEQAVAAMSRPETIYEANIQTLRRLGREGWAALGVGPSA